MRGERGVSAGSGQRAPGYQQEVDGVPPAEGQDGVVGLLGGNKLPGQLGDTGGVRLEGEGGDA